MRPINFFHFHQVAMQKDANSRFHCRDDTIKDCYLPATAIASQEQKN